MLPPVRRKPYISAEKLRTLEESPTRLWGPGEDVALALRIGAELTRLIP